MKIKVRKFQLKYCMPFPMQLCERYAKEVIESMEKDDLLVFDPKDTEGLKEVCDKDGTILIHNRAKTTVSIKEWLPIGCQYIRYGQGEEMKSHETAIALYSPNTHKVLWPAYAEHKPEGPAAFYGEILICPHKIGVRDADKSFFESKFKCVVAHELVHVFEYLRFIIPAFINWRSFWHTFLDDGLANDILLTNLDMGNTAIDRYGTQLELACLQNYWPSQAKKWFDAFRQDSKAKNKKR